MNHKNLLFTTYFRQCLDNYPQRAPQQTNSHKEKTLFSTITQTNWPPIILKSISKEYHRYMSLTLCCVGWLQNNMMVNILPTIIVNENITQLKKLQVRTHITLKDYDLVKSNYNNEWVWPVSGTNKRVNRTQHVSYKYFHWKGWWLVKQANFTSLFILWQLSHIITIFTI